jgi:DNA-binding response OmpR family regulator
MKKRILIADDEVTLLHSMAFTLKRKGFDVEIFEDGESAFLKIMETHQNDKQYDLIITDIQMPGLSGLELISKINATGINTPILAITAFGNMNMVADLMKGGSIEYLDKPFSMKEMIDRILKLLNKKR